MFLFIEIQSTVQWSVVKLYSKRRVISVILCKHVKFFIAVVLQVIQFWSQYGKISNIFSTYAALPSLKAATKISRQYVLHMQEKKQLTDASDDDDDEIRDKIHKHFCFLWGKDYVFERRKAFSLY
jgi:hypothetical protein